MKKILSIILTVVIFMLNFSSVASAESNTKATQDIFIRDPFILTFEGKYYMYGTGAAGAGYGCYVSDNLNNWSGPYEVFSASNEKDFDGIKDFWAPECHYYNGNFYLFATYYSSVTQHRGTAVFKADNPLGPFTLHSNGHITPKYRDCIDGTLYVDDEGQPWIIYVNEWTSNKDEIGTMAVSKLSDDLSFRMGEPKEIFRADGHLWTDSRVTDGPFIYKTSEGKLMMLWSNSAKSGGYAVGLAYSSNGKIDGRWIHEPFALYKKNDAHIFDGGHGMLFYRNDGQLMMSIHSPNDSSISMTTALFLPVKDCGYSIELIEEKTAKDKFQSFFTKVYNFVADLIIK
ncbi:MAG: glycoside hydrolase family 43 protein [Clostridia bacterium]|nr:glycoside hydrolase family 43 protein [Clostridia bacterium]